MNLTKSIFSTFGAFGGIILGIIAIVLGFRNSSAIGYICGIPALLVGILLLIQAYRHINIDY
jgi:hypothetical protein